MNPPEDQPPAHDSLPDYVRNLIDAVTEETGYDLACRIDPLAPYAPRLHIGSSRQRVYLLSLPATDLRYQTHLTLAALHKIQRITGAPPREQLVGVPRAFLLPTADHQELGELFPTLPARVIEQLSEGMALSLVSQLMEVPVDIRVEHEIALSWPEHRKIQQSYLRSRVEHFDFVYDPRQETILPRRSLDTLRQINGAYLQECMNLSGSPAGLNFEAYRQDRLDRELLPILDACTEPGHIGDRQIIDQWADHLGMRDWYVWYRRGQ